MARAKGLTPQQRAFCEYYAANGNATEAARQAGYNSPVRQAGNLMNDTRIALYIAELATKESKVRIATAQERHEWWTRVMLGLEGDADMKDRLKASELLGKSQGDFIERKEISGKDGAPLQVFTEITYTPVKSNNGGSS
jgi:phage terminase small subunit